MRPGPSRIRRTGPTVLVQRRQRLPSRQGVLYPEGMLPRLLSIPTQSGTARDSHYPYGHPLVLIFLSYLSFCQRPLAYRLHSSLFSVPRRCAWHSRRIAPRPPFYSSSWRKGIGRASMVSAVDAPRCGESTSSPGAGGTKQSDGVQSGCTPCMAALSSGPPLILVGLQLRPFSSSARAMRDVPFILQLGSSPCIGLERCHSLEAGPSGGLSPPSSSSSSLAFPCLLHFYHSSPSSPSTLRRRGPWARPSVQLCAVPWMASAIFSPLWGSSSSKWHLPLSARRALSSALRACPSFSGGFRRSPSPGLPSF